MADNGANVESFKIIRILHEPGQDDFQLLIHAWPSNSSRHDGFQPVWRLQITVPMDILDYQIGFREAVLAYLISHTQFEGGESSLTDPALIEE